MEQLRDEGQVIERVSLEDMGDESDSGSELEDEVQPSTGKNRPTNVT